MDAEIDVQSKVENSKQMAAELIGLMKQLTPEDREALGRETHEEVMKDIVGRSADRKAA